MVTAERTKGMRPTRTQSSRIRTWTLSGLSTTELTSRSLFFVVTLTILTVATICLVLALGWVHKPFAGFLVNERMVPGSVGLPHWTGTQAGLRYPDHKILTANDQPIASMQDLEKVVRSVRIGEPITYSVAEGGRVIAVAVPTMPFTLSDLLLIFGTSFLSGITYLLLGVVVFILKPDTKVSWAFLLACVFLGIYTVTSFDLQTTHVGFVRLYLLVVAYAPAALTQLSFVFPENKKMIERHPSLHFLPYFFSTFLVIPLQYFYPKPLFLHIFQLIIVYFIVGAMAVVSSCLHAFIKGLSIPARQRAKAVLFGAALGFSIPAALYYFSLFGGGTLFGVKIETNFLTIPLLIFPASIAYAITRHDLFAIDVIIRRTAGYVLSTAAIVGAYALIISGLNVTFQSAEVAGSPLFSLAFALGVVFLFEPLHKRLQGLIDRLFYRQQYDYRTTIRDISETMIRILDPEQIHRTLLGSVVREMFLENGIVLLPDAANHGYQVRVVEGVEAGNFAAQHLGEDDPLVHALQEKNGPIFQYDVELQPLYEPHRETLQATFEALASDLMLPLKYKDEMRGIISLGRKKSGKMFTPEDLDLLRTITNQSAIALENAKLFEENLEKGRMEEELKIAHDIQTSMLPDKAPKIEGFTIAAHSISAREVGGDFYDFIEMSGNGTGKRLAVVVGDVSGKAVSGALVMAASRSIFRVLAESYASVEKVMAIGNARLNSDIKKGMFVALVYAVLDPQRKVLTLSNAGQTQPIICRQDQSAPAYIDTEGDRFPLGIVRRCKYLETHVPLQPGDTLVFYTDGVVEAMNDQEELYGFERFIASIDAGRALGAEALLKKLMDDVACYVGDAEPHDDLTIVVVGVE